MCTIVGAGFSSNQMFLFGEIDMQVKLVPGHSAGTVVAYYVINTPFYPMFYFFVMADLKRKKKGTKFNLAIFLINAVGI